MKIINIDIEQSSPWQNRTIESFHAPFREECLNRKQLCNLTEARVVIEDWRGLYHNVLPHSSLNNITPCPFVEDAYKQGSGALRIITYMVSSLACMCFLSPRASLLLRFLLQRIGGPKTIPGASGLGAMVSPVMMSCGFRRHRQNAI